jgi:equilibrative nucleoside transporter 1/2/3
MLSNIEKLGKRENYEINEADSQINVVDVIPVAEAVNDDVSQYHKGIYWRLLFLNLVILWSYQSLISAQNYYSKFFPDDHIDFWGTVSAGSVMFILHITQLYFHVYKLGFTKRMVPGFIGYIIIAILVMSIKNSILLIIAFGVVGGLNTLTESPVYGIAGLFTTGSFTQAVQVGNGLAGFLNVSANTIIRLIVLLLHSNIDNDQLSFYIFMSVLIILCFLALYVYYRLIHLPPVKIRLSQQMASFQREKLGDTVELHLIGNELSFWRIIKILKIHFFVQFYTLFITLLLWPGIPCTVTNNGWFNSGGKDWWCSPFIIGTFNMGDLIGRTVALKVHQYFSEKTCLAFALLRTLFILIIFYRYHIDNILLLCLITLMGITNGLLATVTFMVRPPTIVGVNNCERAAYLMTAALYFGIATGSILAVTLKLTHVL